MLYHYLQKLHSPGIKIVYEIKTPDKAIGKFWWFVSDIMIIDSN